MMPGEEDESHRTGTTRHTAKSNTEIHRQPGAAESVNRRMDGYPRGEEGGYTVPPLPWMSGLAVEGKVNSDNDAGLNPTARLLQQSWKKTWQGQGRESGLGAEQQQKVTATELVTLSGTPTWAAPPNKTGTEFRESGSPSKGRSKLPGDGRSKGGQLLSLSSQPYEMKCLESKGVLSQTDGELTGKFRDCPSSPVNPKLSQTDMFDSVSEVVSELVDGVSPHEPKVKCRRKVGRPSKNINSKMQDRQKVDCPQKLDTVQPRDSSQNNNVCDKSSSIFDKSKKKLEACEIKKIDDQSLENVEGDMALKSVSNKAGVRLLDSNSCQVEPFISSPSEVCEAVSYANVKPRKKMGRPRKEFKNEKEGTMKMGRPDSITSVQKSSNVSSQALSGKNTLETAVCAHKKKRGRGQCLGKSVPEIPSQEHDVGKVKEIKAETISPPQPEGSVQEIIFGQRVAGTELKDSTLVDLKATPAPNPIRPLHQKRQKRGRRKKIFGWNKKNSVSFDKQNSVSHQDLLPPSKIKTESEGMDISTINSSVKETVKKEVVVVREHNNGGDLVRRQNSEVDLKLKRKIGRPFKKKTLIKMAKQLALAQVGTADDVVVYDGNHPKTYVSSENIPLHEPQNYKLKRERKKVELWSPVSQLRRYNRACKTITDYSVEKLENHTAASHKKDVRDPNMDSEQRVCPTSALLSISKSEDSDGVKPVTWKKRKGLHNKRKNHDVIIKDEEIPQPVFSEFSKIQDPSAFQESLPLLSKETLPVSEAGDSVGKRRLKNCKMKNKRMKTNQVRLKMESSQSVNTQSKTHEISAVEQTLLVPKDFSGTTLTTSVAGKVVVPNKGRHAVRRGKGKISQKNVRVTAQIKIEPTLELALSNVSASNHTFDSHTKYLLPPQSMTQSTGNKGLRRPGRPPKNKVMIPTVKSSEEVKKETAANESGDDRNNPVPQESLDKDVSCVKLPADVMVKKPRKVDRRRKKFRHQKAQELQAFPGASKRAEPPQTSEPAVQFTSEAEDIKDVGSLSQKHSNKRKLDTDVKLEECGDSDPVAKRARKTIGSRKRRRRKRSWWDDRGKAKAVSSEKYLGSTVESSVGGHAEEGLAVKTDSDGRTTTKQQSISSYLKKLPGSEELPSHTDELPLRSVKNCGKISIVESSDKVNLSNSVSGKETKTEKSSRHKGNPHPQKDSLLDKIDRRLSPDNSISENQRTLKNPKNEEDQTGKRIGESADKPKDINPETTTFISNSGKQEEAQPLKRDAHRRKPGRPRKGDQQLQASTHEEKVIRMTKEEDPGEVDVEDLESEESETQILVNQGFPSKLSEEGCLSEAVLRDRPDAEINQAVLSEQISSGQAVPPDGKERTKLWDGLERSDQELEEINSVEEDPAEAVNQDSPLAVQSTKPRGPGRPPKLKGKPIECQFCGRAFHHISAYIIHRRVHTGERPYNCQECGKTFAQLSNLNTHRKIHKVTEDLHCPLCSDTFSDRNELLAHGKMHHQEKNQPGLPRKLDIEGSRRKDQNSPYTYVTDGKPHICAVCGKGFRYSSMLKIHMRVHSGEKPYSCKVCGKSFSQACSVRVHEKIHWSIKPYICNICGKGFSQLGTLRTHFYTHTGEYRGGKLMKNKVTFHCRTCNKSFLIWHQYNLHLKIHMDAPYSCDLCGQQYRQMSDLTDHRQTCGKPRTEENMQNKPVFDMLQKSQKQNYRLFQSQSTLHSQLQNHNQPPTQEHQQAFSQNHRPSPHQIHQSTQNEACQKPLNPHPQRNTSQQSVLNRTQSSKSKHTHMTTSAYPSEMNTDSSHQHNHTRHSVSTSDHLDRQFDPRKYLCPRCGRLFRHLGRLRAHMLTHVRGQSYTCGRCGKTLENWNKFWLHQRVHRQKRGRFFCPKCGQGFRFAGMYKEHVQGHEELKGFPCPLCPQTFSHVKSLKAHQRDRHKPHKCNVCGKSFHLQGNLARHSLIHRHTHPECCPQCSLSFPDPSSLQDHMKSHVNPLLEEVSPEQAVLPYQCGECEASFRNLDMLFRHQLLHSPPRDGKPWCNREIVGQVASAVQPDNQFKPRFSPANRNLRKSPYFHMPPDDMSDHPSSSSVAPQLSTPNTNPSSHPEGSRIRCTYSPDLSQHASNKPGHASKLQSLENDTHLPQTLAPSTAVPFSESPQTSTSVQSPVHAEVQTSPNFNTEKAQFSQKPLRTYEKSMRGFPRAPSFSNNPQNEEDSSDSVECAECGAQFRHVPELYEHYLQHARGEV